MEKRSISLVIQNLKSAQLHCQMTSEIVAEYEVILCVGDTTFLDYDGIVSKKRRQ